MSPGTKAPVADRPAPAPVPPPVPSSDGPRVAALGAPLIVADLAEIVAYKADLETAMCDPGQVARRDVISCELSRVVAEIDRRMANDPAAVRVVPQRGPAQGVMLCEASTELLEEHAAFLEHAIARRPGNVVDGVPSGDPLVDAFYVAQDELREVRRELGRRRAYVAGPTTDHGE